MDHVSTTEPNLPSPSSCHPSSYASSSTQKEDGKGWPCSAGEEDQAVWAEKLQSMMEKLDQARKDNESQKWKDICIYRIPARLRASTDKEVYTPLIVSIGPYHRGNPNLQKMEQHKWRALQYALKRREQQQHQQEEVMMKLYFNTMKNLEERARACYEGPLMNYNDDTLMSSTQFVEMLVLDGCFILECFFRSADDFTDPFNERNDPVFSMSSTMMQSIRQDMLMLENQLPLFVLDELLKLQRQLQRPDRLASVVNLTINFFDPLMPTDEPILTDNNRDGGNQLTPGRHCLDVIRQNILGEELPKFGAWDGGSLPLFGRMIIKTRSHHDKWKPLIPCVTNLKDAGVKLKMKENPSTTKFWDVTFSNRVIHMPKIVVDGSTMSLFFNLMVYEQCHTLIRRKNCKITAYVTFLDMLIDSAEDISYLRSRDIMDHHCGSDVVAANQFDSLTEGVIFEPDLSYLAPLCREVNKCSKHRWNVWRAILKRRYFNNPWAIISFVAAVFLLFLTFFQTIYTVTAYYKPS